MKRKSISFEDKCLINGKSNYRCAKCGKKLLVTDEDFSVDHVMPISKGGDNDLRNMVGLCVECNQAKGDNFVVPRLYYPYLNKDSLTKPEGYYLDRIHVVWQFSNDVYDLFMQSLN